MGFIVPGSDTFVGMVPDFFRMALLAVNFLTYSNFVYFLLLHHAGCFLFLYMK